MKFVYTLIFSFFIFANPSFAQLTAEDGLKQVDSNITNVKKNIQEYEKNQKLVENNLNEVIKAKGHVSEQKKTVDNAVKENAKLLKSVQSQIDLSEKLITDETKSIESEKLKIAELEKWITKLNENIVKRQNLILNYQEQKQKILSSKMDVNTQKEELMKMQNQVGADYKEITSNETTLKAKIKGYQGEISRWQKELAKQESLKSNLGVLVEAKDGE